MNAQKRLNWNHIADTSPTAGWPIDRLLRRLIAEATQEYGSCDCDDPRKCYHAAAAGLTMIISIIDNPQDCPRCREIDERNKRAIDDDE
jgi:hypothetical protein